MEQIFDTVLELSLAGSVIILVILALRLVLGAVPQRYVCLLWILAGLRLLVPFSFESSFSLQPDSNAIEQWMPTQAVTQPETPVITPAVGEGMQLPQMDENHDAVSNPRPVTVDWAALGWAVVAGCFLMYMAGSYLLLKRKVRGAVAVDGNIYECGGIDSPFVLGYLRPRIYLPEDLPSEDIDHILAHEQCHIRRADHWIKLMGFVCLAVHWFNPLVWLAYGLLCRDVEMACDEEVVAGLSADGRKAYSATLLRCVSGHRLGAVCPVAFGEVSVKQRIPKILHFRKPTFWIGVVAGVVVAIVAVCFLTDPLGMSQEAQYVSQCREAFEAWQDMEIRHILVETSYEGERVLNFDGTIYFWRDGERYLRRSSMPMTLDSEMRTVTLVYDGKLLERIYYAGSKDYATNDTGWVKLDDPLNSAGSWVDNFEWQAHTVEFLEVQENGGRMVILLSVTENPERCDEDYSCTENPYTLSFSFAADGTLSNIQRATWYSYEPIKENDSGIQWTYETFKLGLDTREDIIAAVDKWYSEAEEAMNGVASDRPYDKSKIPGA